MTDQPQSEHCDIENQCTHFCVYKGRYCPVYLRISRPRTPAPSDEEKIDAAITFACEKHDAAIVRTATLALLDDITKFRKDNAKEMKIHDMWVAEAEYLESLRRTAQEQQR
jgi:hypothetical protein